ncbi:hypothetical protein ACX80H_09150 [Arthrobacter sp. MDT2-2]
MIDDAHAGALGCGDDVPGDFREPVDGVVGGLLGEEVPVAAAEDHQELARR